jgi:hypothetical protein
MGLPRHRIVRCQREQVKRRLSSASFLKDRFPGGERLVCESAQLRFDERNQLVEGCGVPVSPCDE